MISFDVFMPLIRPRAQGVPDPIAVNAIRQAAIEFCTKVKLWRGTDKFYATNIDDIALPANAALLEVNDARFDGVQLEPISVDEMNQKFPDTDWMAITGENPRYFTQTDQGTIKVLPTCEGYVDLSLILVPSYDAKELPDFLLSYRQLIADGALAEIMSIPNQTYTNANLATFHAMRFNTGLDSHSAKAIKGQIRAKIRTKPSYF